MGQHATCMTLQPVILLKLLRVYSGADSLHRVPSPSEAWVQELLCVWPASESLPLQFIKKLLRVFTCWPPPLAATSAISWLKALRAQRLL